VLLLLLELLKSPALGYFDAATVEAMTAVIARPTEFPICARVLKTPPARDCLERGKASAMMRLEIV